MKRWEVSLKKKMLLIFLVLAVVALMAILIAFLATDVFAPFATGSIDERGEEELEQIRQEEIAHAFDRQNTIFGSIVSSDFRKKQPTFMPINLRHPHIDGISLNIYLDVMFYERETGNILTYEHIIDYLSQEFEDDGEMRIFTNGRHPEIAEYLEWAHLYAHRRNAFLDDLQAIYDAYIAENEEVPRAWMRVMPLEIMYEILRKEADPEYVMDLTSIKNRYIADGRAVVSEDGRLIEFIVLER